MPVSRNQRNLKSYRSSNLNSTQNGGFYKSGSANPIGNKLVMNQTFKASEQELSEVPTKNSESLPDVLAKN